MVLVVCGATCVSASAQVTAPPEGGSRTSAHVERLRDYDAARALALAEGKDLLLFFTGSDWCAPCAKLEAEVLTQAAFLEAIHGRFVFVELDFPRGEEARARVPQPERQEELRRSFTVGGLPTLLLVEPEGAVLGRAGYLAGGPAPLLAELDAALTARDSIDAAAEGHAAALAALAATGAQPWTGGDVGAQAPVQGPAASASAAQRAEWSARVEALGVLERFPFSPCAGRLQQIVRPLALSVPMEAPSRAGGGAATPTIDPRWRPTRALVGAGLVDPELIGVAIELDPRNVTGLYELAVRAFVLGVRDAGAARAAVEFADGLAKAGSPWDPALALDIWTNASDWSALVVGDAVRASWFARLALRGPLLDPAVERRMRARAESEGGGD